MNRNKLNSCHLGKHCRLGCNIIFIGVDVVQLSILFDVGRELESVASCGQLVRHVGGFDLEISQLVVANFDRASSCHISIFRRLFEDESEHGILDCIESTAAFDRRLVEMLVVIDVVPENCSLILNIGLVFQNLRVDVKNVYSVQHMKL